MLYGTVRVPKSLRIIAGGTNIDIELKNLFFGPISPFCTHRISKKCPRTPLHEFDFLRFCTFCPIFCLENQLKIGENHEILNFASWPKYGIHRHYIAELCSFLTFFDICECYFGVPHPTVVPRHHLRGPYWTMLKMLEYGVWDRGSTQIPKDHSRGHQYQYWA